VGYELPAVVRSCLIRSKISSRWTSTSLGASTPIRTWVPFTPRTVTTMRGPILMISPTRRESINYSSTGRAVFLRRAGPFGPLTLHFPAPLRTRPLIRSKSSAFGDNADLEQRTLGNQFFNADRSPGGVRHSDEFIFDFDERVQVHRRRDTPGCVVIFPNLLPASAKWIP